MSFLAPLALLFGLLAVPILILYMLRLRRKEVLVSSTMLWQMLLRDRQANTPWQKLRRNLLLLVQLVLLALLVLASARPAIPTPMIATGSLVILLDASASMSATDVSPTRFAAATQAASSLLNALSEQAALAVILVDHQPRLLAQASGSALPERQAAQQALQNVQPSAAAADWDTAFALAAAAAANWQAAETTFVIISDGGLPQEGLPALPGPVRYVPVGSSDNNLAISALSLRQVAPDSLRPELFVRVTNYSSVARTVVLSVYFDAELLSAQQLSLPASGSQSFSMNDLPARAGVYRAEISSSASAVDDFSLDNLAYAVYNPRASRRVLVASEEYFTDPPGMNIFLEQILASLTDISAYRVSPDAAAAAGAGFQIPTPAADPFDLYIFDGVLPTDDEGDAVNLPAGNLLLIDPPENELFEQMGVFTPTQAIQASDHPLLADLNQEDFYVAQARQIRLPTWGETVLRTQEGLLVFAGQSGSRRVAVLTFDLNDSDLPLKITFPVLFARLIDYLIPAQGAVAPDGLAPGEPLVIPNLKEIWVVEAVSPGGTAWILDANEEGFLFSQSQELGLFTIRYLGASGEPAPLLAPDFIAVNLFDPSESQITPAGDIVVGRSSIPPAQEQAISQRELWRWLAGLALLVLLVEWWIYHRRQLSLSFLRKPGSV